VDEDFTDLESSCSVGVGACQASGNYVCTSNGLGTECNAIEGTPSEEICGDGIDNNCDGVVDEGCGGPSVTIIAHKIVCDSEEYLPDWGSVAGQPPIDENTAQAFVDANSEHCHFEQGWDFQWAFDAENPGDNIEYAGTPWNTFGSTDSNGKTSVVINNADSGEIHLREALKPGYFPFSDDLEDDVTAEFYCDGDVFNYDNLDYIKDPIEGGEEFYCVGFNALMDEPNEEPVPTCSVDSLNEVNGDNSIYYFSDSIYINEEGIFEVYGSADIEGNDESCKLEAVQYNRTSPYNYLVPSWKGATLQYTLDPETWKTDRNDNEAGGGFVEGWHEVCCRAIIDDCESCGSIVGDSNCQEFCIDTTEPVQVTGVYHSNPSECVPEYVNVAPEFSWDAVVDNGCAPISYEIELYFSNGTLIDTYETTETVFTVPSERLVNGEDYYVIVRAVDEAGNEGQWSLPSVHVYYDNEDPVVTITGQPWDVWYNSDFNVFEEDTDNLGVWKCEIAVDGDGDGTFEGIYSLADCNSFHEIDISELCPGDGDNVCWVRKQATDYACNVDMEGHQWDLDRQAPTTTKTVGTPKINASDYPDLFQWVAKLINGFFVKDTTTITLSCADQPELSGCATDGTYYTIDFQPFNEDGTYGAWSNVVTGEVYDGPFTLNEGDGLYNITYWSVDNAGNVEEAKFEVDKVDLYAPKTSMSFTGMVVNGPRTIPEFNLPVLMDFIKPSCDNNPIINLTATDSEVGVDKTYYQILVPSETETNHLEGYINGQWYEENSEEFQTCLEENNCGIEPYTVNPTGSIPATITVEDLGDSIRWSIDMDENDDSFGGGHAAYGLIIASSPTQPEYQIHSNDGSDSAYPFGTHLYSEWGPDSTVGYNGWQTGTGGNNVPVTSLPWVSATGERDLASNPQIIYTITISKDQLNGGNFYWAAQLMGQTSDTQFPETWAKWQATGIYYENQFTQDYSACEEECGITYWKLSEQFSSCLGDSQEEWCEYDEEQGIVFAEECDHKICYKSVDRLGNIEEEGCTVFSIDGEGPSISISNPYEWITDSVKACGINLEVEAFDEKSGIDNTELLSGVDYTLEYINGTEIESYPLDHYRDNVYYLANRNIDLEGLPAGEYRLIITARDKLGNVKEISRDIFLEPGIFVDEDTVKGCSVGLDGGPCNITFDVCVRDASSMTFGMSKIKSVLSGQISANQLDATLFIGDNFGDVGQRNETSEGEYDGYESTRPPEEVDFTSPCEINNGVRSFIVSLDFPDGILKSNNGEYTFDYEVIGHNCEQQPA